jgi:hypothetical protein
MTRPSPTARERIDTVEDALDWMRERRGLYTGEIGDVATLILGRWEIWERAYMDAIGRLHDQRGAAARMQAFLGRVERELARSDEEWAQVEAMAKRLNDEADAVLNPDSSESKEN